jgi:thiamine-monophosphate kinase
MKVKDIGEFGLIKRITRKPKDKDILVGIGDDAAVIKIKEGFQVLTTDCLVEGDHFRRDWFTPKQIGMKAVEINVSDIAAMGAMPKYMLVSIAIPKDLDVEYIDEIYNGMWNVSDKYNIEIIGGNMTHCNSIVISITMIGETDKKNLTLRSGAKPGDLIFVSGHLGNGRAGLRAFQKKLTGFGKIKKRYLEPYAQLKTSYKISPFVNSMIDISDGLAPEIGHICDESKYGAIIFKDKIPIGDDVKSVAKKINEDGYEYALFGGEDFELVYTVSKEYIEKVSGFLVGEITKNKDVKLSDKGKEIVISKCGYDHFSSGIKINKNY